jgi:hypothetical protein
MDPVLATDYSRVSYFEMLLLYCMAYWPYIAGAIIGPLSIWLLVRTVNRRHERSRAKRHPDGP